MEITSKLKEPVKTSLIEYFDEERNNYVYLKNETEQWTGAFKYRGVYNKIKSTDISNYNGLVTASTGNHGQAVSLSCYQMKFPCTIVLPINTPKNKVDKIRGYNATIFQDKAIVTYDDAVIYAKNYAVNNNYLYIPSFDDYDIIKGHKTMFVEATENHSFDYCFCQIGGGGLFSACLTSDCLKDTKIIGIEMENQDPMNVSLNNKKKTLVELCENEESFCEGILVKEIGDIPFKIATEKNAKISVVSEKNVKKAIKILNSLGIFAEGAGASGFAGYLNSDIKNSKVLCIISGKNIEESIINKILNDEI